MTTVEKYIRSVRNALKKDYATRYWAFLSAGGSSGENGPDRGKLSAMAAQSVRLELVAISRENRPCTEPTTK